MTSHYYQSSTAHGWHSRVGVPSECSGGRQSWQCGDSLRLKRAVSRFAKKSSLHGIHYVFARDRNTSRFKRFFYGVLFAAMLLATLVSVTFLVQESFSMESVYVSKTSKEVKNGPDEDPHFPAYPRIVICRRPAYRMDVNASYRSLLDYAFLSLGYPFPSLTPEERSLMLEVQYAKQVPLAAALLPPDSGALERAKRRYDRLKVDLQHFNLTRFLVDNGVACEDVFAHCYGFVIRTSCCELFSPVLTPLGNCYGLVMDSRAVGFVHMARVRSHAFQFTLDLRPSPQPRKALDTGYEVHLLDPRDEQMAFAPSGGHALINGFMTIMRSRLIKTSRSALYASWHGRSHSCPRLPAPLDPRGYGERYFKKGCEYAIINKLIRDECGCRYVWDTTAAGNLSLLQCDPEDVYGCFVGKFISGDLDNLDRLCTHPCIEYEYYSDVNYVKIGDNGSRLVFTFDGIHYSLHEYRKTTLSGFLSQIGGALGLYLGASLVTAVELLIFLASCLWYRLMPRGRASVITRY